MRRRRAQDPSAKRTEQGQAAGARWVPAGILQRKCACGRHTNGEGVCEECRKSQAGALQRAAVRSPAADEAPPIVSEVLSAPGQPLDRAARDVLEPRFGRDFSRVRLRTGGPGEPQGKLTVNRPDDAYEQEADRVAESVTRRGGAEASSETARRYDFGDVRIHTDSAADESARAVGALAYTVGRDVVFAAGRYAPASPEGRALLAHELTHVIQQEGTGAMVQRRRRLLAWTFKDGELQAYLEHLETGSPERGPDSHLKAREVLKRRKKFEPLSVEVQALLCEELLLGGSRRDDKAILEMLEEAASGERQQIVRRVGRDRLWAAFEGRRRQVVEALTLTAADFQDTGLIDRLKSLPERHLEPYLAAATDPAVRAAIDKILKLQKISTPLDFGTQVDEAGVAHLTDIPGFKVKILPDTHSGDISGALRAHTHAKPDYKSGMPTVQHDATTGTILSFKSQPDLAITIVTKYGPGIFATSRSAYGRGTTPEDRKAKKVNVRFHEGTHGTDIIEYLKKNPPPAFPGQTGVPVRRYQKMQQEYIELVDQYFKKLEKAIVEKGDCVGVKISGGALEELGLSRTYCSQIKKASN